MPTFIVLFVTLDISHRMVELSKMPTGGKGHVMVAVSLLLVCLVATASAVPRVARQGPAVEPRQAFDIEFYAPGSPDHEADYAEFLELSSTIANKHAAGKGTSLGHLCIV